MQQTTSTRRAGLPSPTEVAALRVHVAQLTGRAVGDVVEHVDELLWHLTYGRRGGRLGLRRFRLPLRRRARIEAGPTFDELWGCGRHHRPDVSSLDLIEEMRSDWGAPGGEPCR